MDQMDAVNKVEGRVIEALPATRFRVKGNDGKEYISYLGGRMRVHKIKVLVGDKVMLEVDDYGDNSRIVTRL